MNSKLVQFALEHCERTEFEKYSQTVIGSIIGPTFKPLGGVKDGGADGFIDADILEEAGKPKRFFQASKQLTTETKIRATIKRLREVGRDVQLLYYASSQVVPHLDKLSYELGEELDVAIRIFDRAYFVHHSADNPAISGAYRDYLASSIGFLNDLSSPSYPTTSPLNKDAQQVCAFLSHEMERRIGTARTLESICDGLILWALEGTDPDRNIFMSKAEVLQKVEAVVPTARRFLRGNIDNRLSELSTKREGARFVNVYREQNVYCLPFESRNQIRESILQDEQLKLATTDAFRGRLIAEPSDKIPALVLEEIPALLHKVLEVVFERQGYDAARHFLSEGPADLIDRTTIADFVDEIVRESGIRATYHPDVSILMKTVLRGVFYSSSEIERLYCARLARTYIMLLTIKNTPEIVEYFGAMARNFYLYVGADIIVRAISEYYLRPEDQMTVNALKIILQAGSTIVLTEAALDEIHSHIHASDREYRSTYAEIDSIVDRELASESDRILIRAYYYAKLDNSLPARPRSWGTYLNNFLSYEKISGPVSAVSMKSLRDTLTARFGLVYEDRDELEDGLIPDEIEKLTDAVIEVGKDRGRPNERIRARNDAVHVLKVLRRRKDDERAARTPVSPRTWWLTQDTKTRIAMALAFPKLRGTLPIMRPEFLINYIAYNPTTKEVRNSLATIFPSLLGIRLGNRMEQSSFVKVMAKIQEVHTTDPARAAAIVAEHSAALMSQNIREFTDKYVSLI